MVFRFKIFQSPFFLISCASLAYLWRTARLQIALTATSTLPGSIDDSWVTNPIFQGRHEPDFHLPSNSSDLKPSQSLGATFSACLLVMEDNHFLIEFLAYHSYVMPLSHVIIAVDPRSRTQPDEVVRRWRKYMRIETWRDHDYMLEEERLEHEGYVLQHFGPEIAAQPELITHRARQRLFYYKCMKKLKDQGRNWVLLTDTDEYLHINYQSVKSLNATYTAPTIDTPGSVGAFLQSELQRPGNNLTSPCIQIPRIRFGALESSRRQVEREVPDGFSGSNFLTLRWRHHASPGDYKHNKISKTLIDLSRVGRTQLKPVTSIHRPIRELCGRRRLYILPRDQVFVIHHYLGSKEQYDYRNDSRTGKERSDAEYAKTAALDNGEDDDIRPWLRGFVHKHGLEEAQLLLSEVGRLL